jgi:hypothetical protein
VGRDKSEVDAWLVIARSLGLGGRPYMTGANAFDERACFRCGLETEVRDLARR